MLDLQMLLQFSSSEAMSRKQYNRGEGGPIKQQVNGYQNAGYWFLLIGNEFIIPCGIIAAVCESIA
jgi:hypothetical protein